MEIDNVKKLCPKCRNPLCPSDVESYEYVCYECDENFYECEAIDYRS